MVVGPRIPDFISPPPPPLSVRIFRVENGLYVRARAHAHDFIRKIWHVDLCNDYDIPYTYT